MAKMNYKRVQSASFCPRTSKLSESERQEVLMTRMGKHNYYAAIAKRNRQAKEGEKAAPALKYDLDELKAVRKHKRDVQRKIDRLEMIKQAAEKDW